MCGAALALEAILPHGRPAPILDPGLELFERDEGLLACPSCLREHREDARRCRPCSVELQRMSRTCWRAALEREPVAELRRRVASGLPRLLASLECVGEFADQLAAEAAQAELAHFGVESFVGHDALDPAEPLLVARLWTHPADAGTARYLLGPFPHGDTTWLSSDPHGRAAAFLRHGRWRAALAVAQQAANRAKLAPIAAEALLLLGRPADAAAALAGNVAEASAHEAAERCFQRALLLAIGGEFAAALADVDAAARLTPQRLAIAQARVEILKVTGPLAATRSALAQMKRIAPAALGGGGMYAALERQLALTPGG